MPALENSECTPCKGGEAPLSEIEIRELHPLIPQWKITEEAGIPRLSRCFTFKDFTAALTFTNQVAALAEAEDHHPAILTEWGKVTVTWWTHAIQGLHRNDFILAARTDRLYT